MQELVQCELSNALDSGASRVVVTVIALVYAGLLAAMLSSLVRAWRAAPGAVSGPSVRSSAGGVLALLALAGVTVALARPYTDSARDGVAIRAQYLSKVERAVAVFTSGGRGSTPRPTGQTKPGYVVRYELRLPSGVAREGECEVAPSVYSALPGNDASIVARGRFGIQFWYDRTTGEARAASGATVTVAELVSMLLVLGVAIAWTVMQRTVAAPSATGEK
jgi:hypothetical protein